ncbi:hypothetical protein WMY93_001987 [Mugilogobius chulae]|uniref:Integrase catalytic domain-containing protein n=1 Tax=Mugilogobius chulae TaxID=88201 RepID=A0AAW0Q7D1_9GOBI
MKEQFVAFMQKVFDNNHAELAPPLPEESECWYLPSFGVYHPRKPEQIRVVFDSSAQCNGISLNNVLLTGPDLNNSLLGVLIRFRRERVAVMADIEQMFHCFVVREDHRDYLRFLWFRDNDPNKDIVEYRMRVHVFGNSPSPAVATYCLRRAAISGEGEYGSDTRHFVEREFYVDDGLVSTPTEQEAITLLQKTQASLSESNLRLHKITSNSIGVLQAFPAGDHAKEVKDLYLGAETVPAQRSLGLSWEVKMDTFTFQENLCYENSHWTEPTGMLHSPKTNITCGRHGEIRYRNLNIFIFLALTPPPLHPELSKEKFAFFSDASTKAIGAVAYLKTTDEDGQVHVGFILGKARLAPANEPTIPRLELCAAVLAVEMAELIVQEIDLTLDTVTFYCDSKVVLGYIHNQSKRFYVYVHNRVQRIRQSTEPKQWRYVPTEHNPADHASRSVQASLLTKTNWFTGPAFLHKPQTVSDQQQTFELVDPDSDVDVRPQVTSCITSQNDKPLDPEKFERFSSWKSLQRAVATLNHVAQSFKSSNKDTTGCDGWHQCQKPHTVDELSKATTVILRAVQRAYFPEDFDVLSKGADVNKKSSLSKLNPVICPDGLLRIGGRLKQADLNNQEKHPVILPSKHHVSTLLIRHYHEQVEHQGRTFTEGAIRAAGIWLIGGKRRISSILHGCVTCRKLRGKRESQKMSDLPQERLSTSPPFTYTGVDVFGPWFVTARRTRGGVAQNKRWAVLFTCLSTRAVHIEVVESMDTSSFINSLRRFFALRGPSEQLHSDCGTNFVGACKELEFHKVLKESEVQKYINSQGCSWHFNPPHSSHMGGAWERMIGIARRILDSMLMRTHSSTLTHEVLCTLMAEVTSIINSRPLVSVSSDPEVPQILTPAMLLTRKQSVPPPPGKFTEKDLYKQQWRQVQRLADQFWSRWKREYLHTLQVRHKWQESSPNIVQGDVVLLKDSQTCRNDWPMALVTQTFPGRDGKVRKIEIKTTKDGSVKKFLRPVTEIVLLLKTKD